MKRAQAAVFFMKYTTRKNLVMNIFSRAIKFYIGHIKDHLTNEIRKCSRKMPLIGLIPKNKR